uniref:Large ribosomal subunit protein uL4c n=1 Tax=Thuretia quercifolia TaxID=189650 RepID=A0A1Z1MK40_9FLOR|nr:ribosomal protein L4 [Thuretia quercifolia]ARW66460.1 ribosomal protein L4 [Thuretia quercifolia]
MQKKIIYSIKSHKNINESISKKEIYLSINEKYDKQMYILHKAIKKQLNEKRQGNAHSKTRSEVRGGGKKPWKQKGTGRARAGSTRSPLWKGGGVIFGPRNKTYETKINKKEKLLAIQTLIYNKLKQTVIIDNFLNNLNKPSTKNVVNELKKIGIDTNKNSHTLIIVDKKNNELYLSIRNLTKIELITVNNINLLSLIKANKILITLSALNIMSKIYDK